MGADVEQEDAVDAMWLGSTAVEVRNYHIASKTEHGPYPREKLLADQESYGGFGGPSDKPKPPKKEKKGKRRWHSSQSWQIPRQMPS